MVLVTIIFEGLALGSMDYKQCSLRLENTRPLRGKGQPGALQRPSRSQHASHTLAAQHHPCSPLQGHPHGTHATHTTFATTS
eukprot:1148881-Pelagomonas_calceolata.AAC.11